MASTTTASPDKVADLSDTQRAWIVEHIVDRCFAATLDHGTALLMLDALELTGDREVLAHALAARYMRDGIKDGSIDVRQVDPELTIGREAAVDLLADQYDREYDASIAKLATVRPMPCLMRVAMHPDSRRDGCPVHGDACAPAVSA